MTPCYVCSNTVAPCEHMSAHLYPEEDMDPTRYIIQRNDYPTSAINSHPWRLWDTEEQRSVGWYPTEEDAETMYRFMNGPEAPAHVFTSHEETDQ
jgi:hypothetical protein